MPPVQASKFWPEWFKKQGGAKNWELGSEKNGMAPDGSPKKVTPKLLKVVPQY